MTTRDWDAQTYDRVSDPQFEWGLEVLDRLPLEGDETVLDAGCGSGRLTAELIARLPRGRVVAVDASPSMVELARARLRDGDRAVVADLAAAGARRGVDAVFSDRDLPLDPRPRRALLPPPRGAAVGRLG